MKDRTWLFVPGHDAYKIRKALLSGADVVIADWEDAVSPSRKVEARQVTYEVFTETPRTTGRMAVRINAAGTTEHLIDLEFLQHPAADVVIVPKAEGASALETVGRMGYNIVPLVESALGIERVSELAAAHPRVERLAFGSLDFAIDVRSPNLQGGEAFLYARSRLVVASRVAGLEQPVDGVFPRLDDLQGLKEETELARNLGFGGKLVIHPKQLETVEQVFAPSEEEVDRARRILEEATKAHERGSAVTQVDGDFIDRPLVLWARSILEG